MTRHPVRPEPDRPTAARPTPPQPDLPTTSQPTPPEPGRPPAPESPRRTAPPRAPRTGRGAAAPGDAGPRRRVRAVRLGARSVVTLGLVSAVGVAALTWPFFAPPDSSAVAHAQDAPWLFAGLLVLLVAVVAATIAESGMGPKAVAMLGVLAATGAALRPIGAGTAGLEPMFFLMVLSGRVLGPGFGYVLGCVTMFASALLTGGVGPWLPYQMLCMGWFTMGAGLLPGPERLRGRGEVLMLAGYGFLAAFAYGTAMNMQGWPFLSADSTTIAFDPDAGPAANLARFLAYCLATSLGWDLGRAVCTVLLTLAVGPAVLKALRRATRRAAFETPVTFTPHEDPAHPPAAVKHPT
ncbi:ECF transporter S component [Streptomyces sp. bgisy153]|uniref:ECF transporter S component n=1 Tax=Streptomyces sp. bgisy153 TaxID=3413793 RepID=UPI003D7284CE